MASQFRHGTRFGKVSLLGSATPEKEHSGTYTKQTSNRIRPRQVYPQNARTHASRGGWHSRKPDPTSSPALIHATDNANADFSLQLGEKKPTTFTESSVDSQDVLMVVMGLLLLMMGFRNMMRMMNPLSRDVLMGGMGLKLTGQSEYFQRACKMDPFGEGEKVIYVLDSQMDNANICSHGTARTKLRIIYSTSAFARLASTISSPQI